MFAAQGTLPPDGVALPLDIYIYLFIYIYISSISMYIYIRTTSSVRQPVARFAVRSPTGWGRAPPRGGAARAPAGPRAAERKTRPTPPEQWKGETRLRWVGLPEQWRYGVRSKVSGCIRFVFVLGGWGSLFRGGAARAPAGPRAAERRTRPSQPEQWRDGARVNPNPGASLRFRQVKQCMVLSRWHAVCPFLAQAISCTTSRRG